MTLQVDALAQAIKNLRNIDVNDGGIDNDQLAEELATAIDEFVKSGDVIVASGSSAGTYKVT